MPFALPRAICLAQDRPSSHVPKLRLQGLQPRVRYRVVELCPSYLWRNPMNGRLETHLARPNWRILLYVPNLIDYSRLLCVVVGATCTPQVRVCCPRAPRRHADH